MGSYNLKYASTMESEGKMAAKIERLLDEHNVDPSVKRRFLLAISEAFTNALIHGNEWNQEKQVDVRIEINDNRIAADIIDQGEGGLEKIRNKSQPSLLDESGRGVDLIRYFCTIADFVETSTGGLKVTLVMEQSKEKII